MAIPALLALSAIHQHLVGRGLRTSTGLVVETGSARETHHFALLGGYGAEAVHPYLALETVLAMHPSDNVAASKGVQYYVKAIGKGLKKVMSKMGISTYMSYTGAQVFEAVGLSQPGGQVFQRDRIKERHPSSSSRGSLTSIARHQRQGSRAGMLDAGGAAPGMRVGMPDPDVIKVSIRRARTRTRPAKNTRR